MFNKKAFPAAMAVTLLLILMPAPSRAATRSWAPLSRPAASLFEKLERWWSQLLNGPERPSSSPAWEKQGCGMDPNGNPLCPGTTQGTDPAPSGSGTK
jgi:hypothetical protein